MFCFGKKYSESLFLDISRRHNFFFYENVKSLKKKNEQLHISFLVSDIKKDKIAKIKHFLILENIGLQKAYSYYAFLKRGPKFKYETKDFQVSLRKDKLQYFFFFFFKTVFGNIKNFDFLNLSNRQKGFKKIKMDADYFDFLSINTEIFGDYSKLHLYYQKPILARLKKRQPKDFDILLTKMTIYRLCI